MAEPKPPRILAIDDEAQVHLTYQNILGTTQSAEVLDSLMEGLLTAVGREEDERGARGQYRLDHADQGEAGYHMVQEALQQQDPYAVVLLDIQMPPGWDGLLTARRIQQLAPLTRIILITAYTHYNYREIQQQIGTDFVLLMKPFEDQRLHTLIDLQIHKWRAASALRSAQQELLAAESDLDAHLTADDEVQSRYGMQMVEAGDPLQLEKARYELILNSVEEGVLIIDRRGTIEYSNPGLERLLGKESSELVGLPLAQLFHNSDAENFYSGKMDRLERAQHFLQEVARDQTPLLTSWVRSALIPVLLVDVHGRVVQSNAAMRGLTGWGKRQLGGNSMDLLLPPEIRGHHGKLVEQFMRSDTARRMGEGEQLFEIMTRGNQRKQVAIGLIPLQLEGEKHVLVLLHDPLETEQWKLFQLTPFGRLFARNQNSELSTRWELQHNNGEAVAVHATGSPLYVEQEGAQKFIGVVLILHSAEGLQFAESQIDHEQAKNSFLSTVSHELRTPLAGVLGTATLLMQQADFPPGHQQMVAEIIEAGQSMLGSVDQMIQYAEIQSGELVVREEPFLLQKLLDGLESRFGLQAEEEGLTLGFRLDPACEASYLGDHPRVEQVLSNLLDNALKFTQEGRVELTVECDVECRLLRFIVEDQGCGIELTDFKRIFHPFEQLDSRLSRIHMGLGLGLYVAQQLSQQLGGILEVDSEPGKGSRFVLTLPCRLSDPLQQKQPVVIPTAVPNRFQGKILLVEDTPEMQLLVQRMLEATGLVVEVANHGEEAVQLGLQNSYDLILMDMQMPIMDGIEATETLRNLGITTPIVALTANTVQANRDRFFEAGCNDFLGKPIDRTLLLRTLANYLTSGGGALHEEEAISIDPELLKTYIERLLTFYHTLEHQLHEQQWSDVLLIAHNLKGSGATFGFVALTELGGALCKAIDEADYVEAGKQGGKLVATLVEILKEHAQVANNERGDEILKLYWSDDLYWTGHERLDREHRELLDFYNQLVDLYLHQHSSVEERIAAADELALRIEQHIEFEEGLDILKSPYRERISREHTVTLTQYDGYLYSRDHNKIIDVLHATHQLLSEHIVEECSYFRDSLTPRR